MKLYNSKPTKIIRLNIKESGKPVLHLAFHECSLYECCDKLRQALYKNLNEYSEDYTHSINIQFREWENSKNGKSTTFTFNGPESSVVRDFIISHFDK
jgi:hypothetical protein